MPATGPQPRRGHEVLRGPGRQVRPRPDLDRRLHDPGHRPGRHLVSCAALKPASGYDGQTHLIVVRNPNYKQSTDPTRKNYVDEVRFLIDSSDTDIYNKIEAGQFDLATSSIPPSVLKKYATTPSLKSHFFQNSGDRTLVPDDEHDAAAVRRHPRPPGDELDHRQGGAAADLGRPDGRRHRQPHRPGLDVRRRSSPTTRRTRPPVTTAASRRRRPR